MPNSQWKILDENAPRDTLLVITWAKNLSPVLGFVYQTGHLKGDIIEGRCGKNRKDMVGQLIILSHWRMTEPKSSCVRMESMVVDGFDPIAGKPTYRKVPAYYFEVEVPPWSE